MENFIQLPKNPSLDVLLKYIKTFNISEIYCFGWSNKEVFMSDIEILDNGNISYKHTPYGETLWTKNKESFHKNFIGINAHQYFFKYHLPDLKEPLKQIFNNTLEYSTEYCLKNLYSCFVKYQESEKFNKDMKEYIIKTINNNL